MQFLTSIIASTALTTTTHNSDDTVAKIKMRLADNVDLVDIFPNDTVDCK